MTNQIRTTEVTHADQKESAETIQDDQRDSRQKLNHLRQVFAASRLPDLAFENYVRRCYNAEVNAPVEGMDPADFLRAPAHWKQILRLPQRLVDPWLKSLHKELKLIIVNNEML